MDPKEFEKNNYNKQSEINFNRIDFTKVGSSALPDYLRSPYILFENILKSNINSNSILLDLCCGDGLYSFSAAEKCESITCLDFAENSINIAKERARSLGYLEKMQFVIADAEKLPFSNNSFDIITCVGSLSYVDLDNFLNEVSRVLKPEGQILFIDSYNHNFIYRFNRFIQVLRGIRSYSTFKRMPNTKTLKSIDLQFKNMKVYYFNIFIWLAPFLNIFLSQTKTAIFLNKLDTFFYMFKKYAFKILITAKNKK
jgi:ubiquinone/menaquinone biosynthesis C-methylase UbiE